MSPFARTREKTIQALNTPETLDVDSFPLSSSPDHDDTNEGRDIFEKRNSTDSDIGSAAGQTEQPFGLPRGLEDGSDTLPIELASLSDRYN